MTAQPSGAGSSPRREPPLLVGTPDFKAEAHARYAELRARGPIHRIRRPDGFRGWMVVGYDLAREALTHPKLGKDPEPAAERLRAAGYHILFPGTGFGGNMLTSDPPEHGRLRRLAASAFTPRRTEAMAPRITEIATGLLDAVAPLGEADMVESYTGPLPMAVICELLGIAEEHRADVRRLTRTALRDPSDEQREGLRGLNALLGEILRERRLRPGPDLLSGLIAVHDEQDGRLSEEELLGTAVLLVVAGHETTVNLLGNAVLALLDHPEQARLLRERPELLPGAVEELLRFDAPVETTPSRFATEEIVLGGQVIPRGGAVTVALTSAGRDAGVEEGGDPDVLDVTRRSPRHLAFGHGIHHCLGAPLGRLEGLIALRVLLERFPDLRWADPGTAPQWIPDGITRGPVSLPVRFTPEEGGRQR
ncbi:cytochrome P450 [Sphaerisporangium sp. TRM90804]|uniref:cytochrome P450 family protein n=1 Tax=Sphaerisporangium sp. TRM90804 TaxID=3031113 RepID=UPI00244D4A3F|nr:cytochrome P450 [Sphaerisporangium sp. TRM90804]MDH2430837.1 cytochrome P450 [Sphaerisporangium sp. TRM90804]